MAKRSSKWINSLDRAIYLHEEKAMLDSTYNSFDNFYFERNDDQSFDRMQRIEQLMLDCGVVNGCDELYQIMEMAATLSNAKYGEHWNINKIPFMMDTDDIYYLRQFPPAYWKQALACRYNHLLIRQWFRKNSKKRKDKKLEDWRWIKVRGPHGTLSFFVDTKINKLYDKLTRPKNFEHLTGVDSGDRSQYEEGGGGMFGYTFDNPKKLDLAKAFKLAAQKGVHPKDKVDDVNVDPQISEKQSDQDDGKATNHSTHGWITEDYVGVSESTVEDRLAHWLDGIAKGWLGSPDEGVTTAKIKWGGGKPKKRWIAGEQWVQNWVVRWQHKMTEALEAAKENEYTIKKMPVSSSGDRVIWNARTENGNVIVAGNEHMLHLMPAQAIDNKEVARHNQYENAHKMATGALTNKDGDYKELHELIAKMRDAKLPDFIEQEKDDIRDNAGKLEPAILESRLDMLVANEAIMALKYWLKEEGMDIETMDVSRFGHDPMRGELLKKFEQFLEIANQRMKAIKANAKRHNVWDWVLGDHNTIYDGKNKRYPRLYKYVTFGGIFPNRQQKGKTVGNPDDWQNIFVHYFGAHEIIGDKPHVLPFTVMDINERTPHEELIAGGSIWDGIGFALNSSVVRKHAPEHQVLSQHKMDLFQAINEWMMWQTGRGEFINFLRAYEANNENDFEHVGHTLYKRIRTMSQNFVISLFQLDIIGRGSVRTRAGRSAEHLSALDEFGDFINSQKAGLDALASAMVERSVHRTSRPASQGASGITGHSISAIRAALEAGKIARKQPDMGKSFEKLATGLAKDVLLASLINVYIAKMTEAGHKVDYADAETKAREALGLAEENPEARQQQDAGQYSVMKKEFFNAMDGALARWNPNVQNVKEIEHGQGPGGNFAASLVASWKELEDSGEDGKLRKRLDTLEQVLEDPQVLAAKAASAGTDNLSTRVAIEYVLNYFGRTQYGLPEGDSGVEHSPQPVAHGGVPQESILLHHYLRELLGEEVPATGLIRVPQVLIDRIMHASQGRMIYDELRGYVYPGPGQRATLGDIDLSRHPRFVEIIKTIVDAIDQQSRQQRTNIGDEKSGPTGIGF